MRRREIKVIIGEPEPILCQSLASMLRSEGYPVETAGNGEEVLQLVLGRHPVLAVLLDTAIPDDALGILREIRRRKARVPIIVISRSASAALAVQAVKSGANEVLVRPVNHQDLRDKFHKVLGKRPNKLRQTSLSPCQRIPPSRAARSAEPKDMPGAEVAGTEEQAELQALLVALNSTWWNRKQAAALLNISYKALLYKIRKYSLAGKIVNPI